MSMEKPDIVYVLTHSGTGYVETATSDDVKAWAYFNDNHVRLSVYLDGKCIVMVESSDRK